MSKYPTGRFDISEYVFYPGFRFSFISLLNTLCLNFINPHSTFLLLRLQVQTSSFSTFMFNLPPSPPSSSNFLLLRLHVQPSSFSTFVFNLILPSLLQVQPSPPFSSSSLTFSSLLFFKFNLLLPSLPSTATFSTFMFNLLLFYTFKFNLLLSSPPSSSNFLLLHLQVQPSTFSTFKLNLLHLLYLEVKPSPSSIS